MARSRTPSESLADFAASTAAGDVPAAVTRRLELHLLDAIGCGLAARGLGGVPAVERVAAGPGAVETALREGALMHALDYDDTHPGSSCHVSAVVGAATRAVAATSSYSDDELRVAQAVGSEVLVRVGSAFPGEFHARGFHPTGVCGVFGAATAVGKLRGLDADRMAHALGIAGSLGSGIFAFLDDASDTKPLHAGWAAAAGIRAADLAAAGMRGPGSVLDGRFGLYATHLGHHEDLDPSRVIGGLGEEWEAGALSIKRYPCCHAMHGALDAALELADGEGDPTERVVEAINVGLADRDARLTIEPIEAKRAPATPYEARFSLPYSVAFALLRGAPGALAYTDEALADPAVRELAGKVSRAAGALDVPGSYPGTVEIRFQDGGRLVRRVDHYRGHPTRPVTDAEILAKFRENAALAIPEARSRDLEADPFRSPIDLDEAVWSGLRQGPATTDKSPNEGSP